MELKHLRNIIRENLTKMKIIESEIKIIIEEFMYKLHFDETFIRQVDNGEISSDDISLYLMKIHNEVSERKSLILALLLQTEYFTKSLNDLILKEDNKHKLIDHVYRYSRSDLLNLKSSTFSRAHVIPKEIARQKKFNL